VLTPPSIIIGAYTTALKEWLPLAEQGDAIAQSNIGVMYERGEAAPHKPFPTGQAIASKKSVNPFSETLIKR
jgi:TPR repeat protein